MCTLCFQFCCTLLMHFQYLFCVVLNFSADVYDSVSMPGGTSLTSSNIALPPPSKNPSTTLPPASKTWNVSQTKVDYICITKAHCA